MAIIAYLIQAASNLPTDASALQSAISALESEIKTLENSSVPWEGTLPWFTGIIALGVAMELWVIWRERCDDMGAWRRGIIRPPDRPSFKKFLVEVVSVLLITGGIVGELWSGVEITSVNGKLRSKGAELRSKSDQLVGLLNVEVENAKNAAAAAGERAAEAELELAKLTVPRTLNSQRVTKKLKPFAGTPFVLAINPVPEAINFAQLISGSALAAKWVARTPEHPPKYGPLDTVTVGSVEASIWYRPGLAVGFRPEDREAVEKAADALASALEAEGFKVDTGLFDKNVVAGSPGAVHIVVGSKQLGEAKPRAEANNSKQPHSQAASR